MEENSQCGATNQPGDLVIRNATRADAPLIKSIERQCGLSKWRQSDYESVAENENGILLVALSSTTPVGFSYTRLITRSNSLRVENRGRDSVDTVDAVLPKRSYPVEAELCNLGVIEEFRRNGVGTRLLQDTLRHFEEYWSFSIFLEVRSNNTAARGFYGRFGFVETGVRPSYYRDPTEDALVLKLEQRTGLFKGDL